MLTDLRMSLRALGRSPGFAVITVVTLSLGIGATTAVFSAVYGILLQRLPYGSPERVVRLYEYHVQRGFDFGTISYPNLVDWRDRSESFESVSVFDEYGPIVMGESGPERLIGASVSASFFDVFGVKPQLGRFFVASEDIPGSARSVVLSDAYWRRRFGGDPHAVGSTLELTGTNYTIVGVAPADFEDPQLAGPGAAATQLWRVSPAYFATAERSGRSFSGVARLLPGIAPEVAEAELNRVMAALAQEYPRENANQAVLVRRVIDDLTADARTPLFLLLVASGFLLAIACANAVNLALARAATQQRDVVLRRALGATRSRLILHGIMEYVVLLGVSGIAGLMLAYAATGMFRALAAGQLGRASNIAVQGEVLLYSLLVTLLLAVILGMAPGWLAARSDLALSLKEGARQVGLSKRRNLVQSALVIAQTSLSLVLLTGAGLLLRSFDALQSVDPGVRATGLLTMRFDPPIGRYTEPAELATLYDEVITRLGKIPGVERVAGANMLPLSGEFNGMGYSIDDRPPPAPGERPAAETRAVTAGFFEAMGIPILRGRGLLPTDRAGTPPVVVINLSMAEAMWPAEDPIGKRLTLGQVSREIVGIVGDVREFNLAQLPEPGMYLPHEQALQFMRTPFWLAIRTLSDPGSLASGVRRELLAIEPAALVAATRSMREIVDRTLSAPRFRTRLLTIFAAVAFFLAAIGVYGVLSRSIALRRDEMGIRVSLGATRRDVMAMVMRQGMVPVLVGLSLGLGVSALLTRSLAGLLFGVTPGDPATFTSVTVLLLLVAAAACGIPALRATRVSPLLVLRSDR
jgi:putative ABC transport system permease protein